MVILLIGIVDVVFAVNSIPAVFAVTVDPFIVLTSNVFAILGLRALFFLLAGMHERFHLLSYGLAIVLLTIGTKMLLIDISEIPLSWSLGFTVLALATTMVLSLDDPPKGKVRTAYPLRLQTRSGAGAPGLTTTTSGPDARPRVTPAMIPAAQPSVSEGASGSVVRSASAARAAKTWSIRLPSMSTISSRHPSHSAESPVSGSRPSSKRSMPLGDKGPAGIRGQGANTSICRAAA